MCGIRRIKEGMKRKGGELLSEEIRRVVGRKKEFFLKRRRTRSEENLEEYRRMKRAIKGWYKR